MSLPAAPLIWTLLAGPELDAPLLYAVLTLRSEVFVVEQECVYQDIDGLDLLDSTVHVIGHADGQPSGQAGSIAAYARVLAPDAGHATPRIGRVIVAPAARGRQLARDLMVRALGACEDRWPGEPVELGAQAHLGGFYASVGFEPVGEPYDEDGIPHQWMRRG